MKNILYIHRNFYSYDNYIMNELKKLGNNIHSFSLRPKLNDGALALNNMFDLEQKISKKEQKKLLEGLERNGIKIDVILVVSGQNLLPETLEKLHYMYPKAIFIWYIWDSISVLKNFSSNKIYFHKIISFDYKEADEYKIDYLPLFYVRESKSDKKIYNVAFIASAHPKRVEIVNALLEKKKVENSFFYLACGRKEYLEICFNRRYKNIKEWVHPFAIKNEKSYEIMSSSRCILDIPYEGQTGLTMRTIETLGLHTKLITTNRMIVNYDFYRSENVYVWNGNVDDFPDDRFIYKEYKEINEEILNKYKLDNWIKNIVQYFSRG